MIRLLINSVVVGVLVMLKKDSVSVLGRTRMYKREQLSILVSLLREAGHPYLARVLIFQAMWRTRALSFLVWCDRPWLPKRVNQALGRVWEWVYRR